MQLDTSHKPGALGFTVSGRGPTARGYIELWEDSNSPGRRVSPAWDIWVSLAGRSGTLDTGCAHQRTILQLSQCASTAAAGCTLATCRRRQRSRPAQSPEKGNA